MKYTLEQKAQLMAIQEPDRTYACEFKDYVMLTDGHVGYYIKKDKLIINCNKVKKPTGPYDSMEPETMRLNTYDATKTRKVHLVPGGRLAIMLRNCDGKKAWVNMDFLKPFGENAKYRISGAKDPIYISDFRGIPLGIVLPMNITDEEVEG